MNIPSTIAGESDEVDPIMVSKVNLSLIQFLVAC